MKLSPKLQPCRWDGLVVLLVVVLAAACALAVWSRGTDTGELTAVVTVDGVETERIPLKEFPDGERTYSGNGYTLHVRLEASQGETGLGLYVAAADCPTQDCVHTGTITRAGQSIVCLPARVIIRLEGGTVDRDAPDVVIG